MKKMKIVKKNDLEINRLSKVYINKKIKTIALKEVSFNVKRGAMLALLGPNGAGKSTLINILAGIANKSSGSAHINGYNIDNDIRNAKASIGVVPQELVIDPYFTPKETLNFQAGYYGIRNPEKITNTLLERLKLKDKENAYVRHLSGGMKRRLMIAKAMVHSPQVLILDEPTAGVDVNLRQLMWNLIKELNSRGTTILITTHYIEEAEAICDDVAIINNGKIVVNGNIKKLIQNIDKKNLKIFLENKIMVLPEKLKKSGFKLINSNVLSLDYKPSKIATGELINKVLKSNLEIKDVTVNEAKLEDLFKQIVY